MLCFNSINEPETQPEHQAADENAQASMEYSWQPVSSTHHKSRTKIISTTTMMIIAAIVTCCVVTAILIFARNNNSGESVTPLSTVAATTAPQSTQQKSTENREKTASSEEPSTVSGDTAATKAKKSLLEFVDSLDLDVDGISPDQPHIKDDTLVLEYYFYGEYTPEDEELPTLEDEEPSLFTGYKERLSSTANYLESQIKTNGYSISKVVVEGYDSTGKQFFHVQNSIKD